MTLIKRTALVPYTARQMFELVNQIEEYPRFLPWCHESHILSQNEQEVRASLEIVWSGLHKKMVTLNKLHPFERIDIELVEGPLKHLEGHWRFSNVGEEGCQVDLNLEFTVAGSLVDRLVEPIFNHIANSLVDAFCERALEVYGYSLNQS